MKWRAPSVSRRNRIRHRLLSLGRVFFLIPLWAGRPRGRRRGRRRLHDGRTKLSGHDSRSPLRRVCFTVTWYQARLELLKLVALPGVPFRTHYPSYITLASLFSCLAMIFLAYLGANALLQTQNGSAYGKLAGLLAKAAQVPLNIGDAVLLF